MLAAGRTYFLTLKFRERGKLKFGGAWDYETRKRHYDIVSKDWNAFRDRMRKGYSMRYVLGPEFGPKTGRIHFHALVHYSDTWPTTKWVRARWKQGHSTCRIATKRHAAYVTDYATKELAFRVRASPSYGNDGAKRLIEGILKNDLVKAVYDNFPGAQAPRVVDRSR
jgi:hypothetical protein